MRAKATSTETEKAEAIERTGTLEFGRRLYSPNQARPRTIIGEVNLGYLPFPAAVRYLFGFRLQSVAQGRKRALDFRYLVHAPKTDKMTNDKCEGR